jgi:F-type H+-transporting ATPase subunit epsilon
MAKSNSIQVVVVTPEKAVLDEHADFVALPMYDGELGVLPGRAPLIGRLGYGEVRIKKGATTRELFVDGGFVEIRDNVVTLLTQRAVSEEDLSVDNANSELQDALQPGRTPDEQEAQLAKQARARAKLRLARKVRHEAEMRALGVGGRTI